MAGSFTEQEQRELQAKFAENDTNGDGRVDNKELHTLVADLGVSATAAELDTVIQQFDTDKDDALNFQEFLSLMAALRELGQD
ncbi:MAG: hypothetical protein J3Q66DRAFT_336628 [Benniella sp.]|nr:MAG: hypothetical protein J3Q66DRAFT_336628 [Benniella sp.]